MQQQRRPRRAIYSRNRAQQGALLSYLLIGVLLFFIVINFFASDREFSDAENRALVQSPELSWQSLKDGSYFEGIDDYLADQFVGRDFWISLRLGFTQLMGATESNGVLLCEDDYLMEKPVAPNEELVTKNIEAITEFAEKNAGLNMYVSIVPTAACVMEDKLPSNAPVRDQQADISALQKKLTGVKFLDVTAALKSHSNEEIYYRTDHHWTSLGAYYAFLHLAKEMELSPIVDYDVYTVSDSFEGTLASKSGSHSATDTVQLYAAKDIDYTVCYVNEDRLSASLYSRKALDTKDHYTVFFGGNFPRINITTTANTGKTLLLFKDSYANCMVQFLLPYYDKIIMIDPRYYSENAQELVSSENVTDVLFLYNINTFHEDSTLHGVLK
ncbi:MAG: hypothetical protein IJF33_00935 [Clostridia bacterium]|nr:hypothetical protein [Clostridia bacterium]